MSAQDFTISPQLGRDIERVRQRSLIVGLVALAACGAGYLVSTRPVLPLLSVFLSLLSRPHSRMSRSADAAILERRRMGHRDPAHHRGGHPHHPLAGRAVYPHSHRNPQALHLVARRRRQSRPASPAQTSVSQRSLLLCPRHFLFRGLVCVRALSEQVVARAGY